MDVYYITFRSVTLAQRGEGVLARAGIRAGVQRTPRWMEEQGCGYCLRLKTGDITAAAAQLRSQHLPYRKIYRQMEDGSVVEVAR